MKPLNSFLPANLLTKLRVNQKLDQDLKAYLAQAMWQSVAVAGLENHELKLLVVNQTLATTLRYQHGELLKHFNTDPSLNIQKISIRVAPSLNKP